MKLINEMAHEEILQLSAADIERMVKYICATDGIKLLPEPVEPVKPKHEPDLTCFRLGDWLCALREPLDKIAEVFNEYRYQLKVSSYDYGLGSAYQKLGEPSYQLENMVKVEPIKVYSELQYTLVQAEARIYKEAKEQFDKDLSEYRKNKKLVEDATNWLWEHFHQANKLQREIDSLKSRWSEYLEIAGGDKEIAEKFMRKAYTISDEQWAMVQK